MAFERLHLHASSSIAAASYDGARRKLRVTFTARSSGNGRTYDYSGVPQETATALVDAESHGRFVNWRIKPYFRYREVQ